VSSGPPPVPGGRSPEEREAARREREARRTGRPPVQVAAAPPREDNRDWLAEAQTLTTPTPAKPASGRRGPRWGRLIALGILLAIVVGIAWFANALFQPFADDGGEPVRVTIPQGSSLSQIADILEREGVVANAGFFQLRARIEGHSGDLRPGSYELREDMSFSAALTALQEGVPPDVVQVAIPEGLSRREIRPLTKGLRGNYVRASRRSPALDPRDYRAPRGATLEGFLFPATYELKKGRRVNALISEQLNHFKRNFDKVDLSFAKRKNLTAYDVLIIASLIDREAMVAKERRLIASVIYNRLKQGIPLGIDATVRFVTNNWKRPLRQSELQNPSPYNTRVHGGLPPGPIGNPGLASIQAAARPAKTGYLFYVVKVDSCGEHKFAETDAEFQAYVNEYNRAREARGGKSPTKC
jgi:cell division protein YceG involved in septum cleavage